MRALGAQAEANARLANGKRAAAHCRRVEGTGRVIPARAFRWVAAAAMLAGVVFAARWWFAEDAQHFASSTAFSKELLADGSKLELSPGSELSVRMGDKRKVTLHGQAYFEVKKDAEHPFVVTAEEMTVTVLGTAFEVTAFDTASSVQVRVREGRVQVSGGCGYCSCWWLANTCVSTSNANVLEREVAGPVEVWGERIIQFEEAPLPDVVQQLEKLFPVRITLGNAALANCKLTASFEDEPIERILQVIAETYGLTITEQAPGAYVLMGDGC